MVFQLAAAMIVAMVMVAWVSGEAVLATMMAAVAVQVAWGDIHNGGGGEGVSLQVVVTMVNDGDGWR